MEHCLHSYTARLLFVINIILGTFCLVRITYTFKKSKDWVVTTRIIFFRDTFLGRVQTYEICVYHSGVSED